MFSLLFRKVRDGCIWYLVYSVGEDFKTVVVQVGSVAAVLCDSS